MRGGVGVCECVCERWAHSPRKQMRIFAPLSLALWPPHLLLSPPLTYLSHEAQLLRSKVFQVLQALTYFLIYQFFFLHSSS